jgi:hypothetical protein
LHVRAAGIATSTLNIDIRFKYILFILLHVGLTEEGRIGSARVAVARFLNALRRIATKERCAADNRCINESCWTKPVANPSEYYFKSDKGQANVCVSRRVDTSHRTWSMHTGPTWESRHTCWGQSYNHWHRSAQFQRDNYKYPLHWHISSTEMSSGQKHCEHHR